MRCPEQFAELPDKERLAIEAANAAIRENFSRKVLALIVALQERILLAHGSRRGFLSKLEAQGVTLVNATLLSRRLGGTNKKGPYGNWWLSEHIAKHCAGDDATSDQLLEKFARLWYAAYGEVPKPFSTADLGGVLAPVSDKEIADLIDPLERVSADAAPSDERTWQSTADLAAWVDSFPDAVLFTDSRGTVVHSNRAAERLWRVWNEGLLDRNLIELLPSFDISRLPHFATSEDSSPAGRPSPLRSEARRFDGQDLLVEVHSVRLDALGSSGETGRATGQESVGGSGSGQLMVLIKDLTGVQKLETELVRQQRQTELILDTAAEGIIRVDAEAQIILANAAAASALAYEPTELIGHSFPSLTQNSRPDGQPQLYADTLLGRSLLEGRPCSFQGQVLKAKDGTLVRVDLRATPVVEGDSRSGSVITFRIRQKNAPAVQFIHPRDDRARAEASRLTLQVMEYHQLLIQILARMDEPSAEAVTQLCGSLPAKALTDLQRSVREARGAIAPSAPALALSQAASISVQATETLSSAVHEGVRAATAEPGMKQTRLVVFAPSIPIDSNLKWLSGVLMRLIVAAAPETAVGERVTISAAPRDRLIRIDIKGAFSRLNSEQMTQVEADVRAHGGTLRLIKNAPEKDKAIIVLEIPQEGHLGTGIAATPVPPSSSEHDHYDGEHAAPARTVQLVSGDYLLTINPVEDSEIEACPPEERPGRPEKLTSAKRAELARATKAPRLPGPGLPTLPLLERVKARERLVRLLARGRQVRLTGPAGSGRTRLLDLVAEDCVDLAPDGVIRLSGFHRTSSDLLYALFHAVYDAPLHHPGRDELLDYVREIGAVVVVDDIEFGGADLDEFLDAAPECAFVIGATPGVPAPSAGKDLEKVVLSGLELAHCVEIIEYMVSRVLTEEERNWASDLWFESGGLPLRFVQAGALLRQRDQADFDVPLPSLGEAAAPAPLLASRLSDCAQALLQFAVALGGEVPSRPHLPTLVGDTRADAALGELASCGLISAVGSRYRLAAGVLQQLEAAGYGDNIEARALTAAEHYAWWAGHPSVTPERVCAEADALLAALTVLVPMTTPASEGEKAATVQLARTVAPAFVAGLHWSAWDRALRFGAEAARLADETTDLAYFRHELGVLAVCSGDNDRARAELETSLGLRNKMTAHDTLIDEVDTESRSGSADSRHVDDPTADADGSKPVVPLSDLFRRFWKR